MRLTQRLIPLLVLCAFLAGCGESLDEQTRYQIAVQNTQRGDHTAAMMELTNILEAHPDNLKARILLGEVWLAAGRYAAADRQLRLALDAGAAPSTYVPYGEALLALGEFDKALSSLPSRLEDSRLTARLTVLRARALIQLGATDDAEKLLDEAAVDDARAVDVMTARSLAALARGRMDEATNWAQAAVEEHPFSVPAHRMLGVVWSARRDFKAAEEAFSRAIEVSASTSQTEAILQARVGLAEAQWRQGNTRNALQNLKSLTDTYPWHPLPRFLRAIISYEVNEHGLAEEYLLEVLRGVPRHTDSERLLAGVNYGQGRLELTRQRLDGLLESTEPPQALRQLRALTLLDMGDYAGSAEALEDLDPGSATSVDLVLLKGRALLYSGRAPEALPYYDAAMRIRPDDNTLRLRTIAVLIAAGRLDEARELHGRIPDRPGLANARDLLALALATAGSDNSSARQLAKAMRTDDPSSLHPLIALARLARQRGDLGRAIDWLQLARLKDPNNYEAIVLLAYTQLAAGAHEPARTTARTGTRLYPYDTTLHNALGDAELNLGLNASALQTFRRAVELAPGNPRGWFNVARAQLETNDFWTGKDTMLKAIDLAPGDLAPVRSLVFEQFERGKPEQALALARELQARRAGHPLGFALEGDLSMARGDFTAAAKAYRLAAGRGDDRLLAIKGYTAGRAAGLSDAESALHAWLERHPDDARVRRILDRSGR